MDKYQTGIQRMKEILGDNAETLIENFQKISPDFAKYIVEFGYADLYMRDGLNDKTRELAAVACLIGARNAGLPLKAHLNGMLNVGWTKNEIIELFIFLIGYVGLAPTVEAIKLFEEVVSTGETK